MPNLPEGLFPERIKQTIQYFDLKEFVNEARQKKMFGDQDLLKPNRPMDNSFSGFKPQEDLFKNNPYLGERPPMVPGASHGGNESYDIDDLIKKIDAKIAQLEAEEEQDNKEIKEEKKEQTELVIKTEDKNIEPKTEEIKINNNIDEVIEAIKEEDNSDDQFFDDFFSNEE
jgi:hypothetical protein